MYYRRYFQIFFRHGYVYMLLLALMVVFLIFSIKKRDYIVWTGYYLTIASMHVLFLFMEYAVRWNIDYGRALANVANGFLLHLIVASIAIHLCQKNKKWTAFYFVMGSLVILMYKFKNLSYTCHKCQLQRAVLLKLQ